MCESERPNDSCSLNRSEMKETNMENCSYSFLKKIRSSSFLKCFAVFFFSSPFSSFFLFFARLFISPVSQLWHAMTVTVVYKSPFPWTVSAGLFWDETTAIRSSPPQTPALFCPVFLPKPPHPTIEHCLVPHRHFKPSGLFSGKLQIKNY